MQTSVAATFGGSAITFKIERQDLPLFEAYAGEPAYGLFREITRGGWTVEQLRSVLAFATIADGRLKQLRQLRRAIEGMSPLGPLYPYLADAAAAVDAVFAQNPIAQYAGLAQSVLAGSLFGLADDDAVFVEAADGE
jgi:hypothetical protein